MISQKDILDYEVRSSWIASYFSNPFLQKLAGKYYAAKVRRKYKRYYDSTKIGHQLTDLAALQTYLVKTFAGRVPATKLLATSENFNWIEQNLILSTPDRTRVAAAKQICKLLKR